MEIVSKSTLKALKNGKKCKLDIDVADEISARVFLCPQANTTHIRAYLMNKNPQSRITEIGQMTMTSHSLSVLPYDIRNTAQALYSKYKLSLSPSTPKKSSSGKPFTARVLGIPDIMNPDNYRPYTKRGWGKTTTSQAVTYYANTLGKFYELFGEDATKIEFDTWVENQVNQLYCQKYPNPCSNTETVLLRRKVIYNSILDRLSQARAVQQYLLAEHPDGDWPSIPIPIPARYKTIKVEELKTVTYKIYVQLCVLTKRLCHEEIPEAYAVLLEILCGARIGESCAPLIGELETFNHGGRYYIGHQVDDHGGRTDILKSEYSYRYVMYCSLFCDLIALRINQLSKNGFDLSDIPSMPFASSKANPKKFISKSRASTFLRELLILVGCDEKWIAAEAERMFASTTALGNSDDLDVTAHLLRRTIATFFGNGGMPANYLDYYLGHKPTHINKTDFSSIDIAQTFISIIERALYLGSLCSTNNPAYSPVPILAPIGYELTGNTKYIFNVIEDMWIDLDISCLEPGCSLEITSTAPLGTSDAIVRYPHDTLANKSERPILPQLPSPQEIEQWIAEANGIDLSTLIKKYGGK